MLQAGRAAWKDTESAVVGMKLRSGLHVSPWVDIIKLDGSFGNQIVP